MRADVGCRDYHADTQGMIPGMRRMGWSGPESWAPSVRDTVRDAVREAVPQARGVVSERVVPGVQRTVQERVIPTVTDRVLPGVQHAMQDRVIPTVQHAVTGSVIPAVAGAVESARSSERGTELRRRYAGVVSAASGMPASPPRSRWPFAVAAFVMGALVGAVVAVVVRRPTPFTVDSFDEEDTPVPGADPDALPDPLRASDPRPGSPPVPASDPHP